MICKIHQKLLMAYLVHQEYKENLNLIIDIFYCDRDILVCSQIVSKLFHLILSTPLKDVMHSIRNKSFSDMKKM